MEVMVEMEETLGVAEGKVGVEEMLKGVGGVEEVGVLEESRVVMAALPLLFPWPVSSLLQLQSSLSSLLPPPCLFLLSSPLPPPPASAPASSNKVPLPVQIQLVFGERLASFPHVDLDPDLIQVPRTAVPSSLFWPLKQT